jgi:tRNA1Val (adenine37-N6)-methyltransferase
MPNNYFNFKNFTIHQDKCGMKVCTDACLFGAYIADYMAKQQLKNALDIGAGTGLLSLQVAQKNTLHIDAIEINEDAYEQAKENVLNSVYSSFITVHHQNILEWGVTKKYDFIFSNPPFYENDLVSTTQNKNQAKHGESLTMKQLITAVKNLLHQHGEFAVLMPYHRSNEVKQLVMSESFYLKQEVLLKQTPNHNYFRSIQIYTLEKVACVTKELTTKDENNNYTPSFILLLKDYYLYL